MKLGTGDRLGDWVIEKPLGAGGMGSVYLAHSALSEAVKAAVKVLEPSDVGEVQQRFIQEMKTLAALNHPAIVRVLGGGRDEARGLLYMAMELVDGEDLESRLRRGPLTVDESKAVFGPVADALAYAHERGIAHRDIKPGNLMIRRDGTPVVVDFGIAVSAGQTRHTKEGMVPGTLVYLPPEIFEGSPPSPRATDAYALGVVLWEALTGRTAFQGDPDSSEGQQMAQIMGLKLRQEALDPGETTPASVRDAIRRTTDPEPGSRLIDLRQVREMLLGDTPLDRVAPLETMDFALDARPETPRRRRWGLIAGVGGATVALLVLGVIGAVIVGAAALLAVISLGQPLPATRPKQPLAPTVAQASTALTAGDLAEARLHAGLAVDDHPEDPTANLLYGQVLLADGDLLLARPYLCAAVDGGLGDEVPGHAEGTLDCERGPGASLPLTSPVAVARLDLAAQAAASQAAVAATRGADDGVADAPGLPSGGSGTGGGGAASGGGLGTVSSGGAGSYGASPETAPARPARREAPAASAPARASSSDAVAMDDEAPADEAAAVEVVAAPAPAPEPEPVAASAPAPAKRASSRSAPAGPDVAVVSLTVQGELTRDTVVSALGLARRAALKCHAQAPSRSGELILKFTIRSDGSLWGKSGAEINRDSVGGDVAACVNRALMRTTFPRDYGGNTAVTWHLRFGR